MEGYTPTACHEQFCTEGFHDETKQKKAPPPIGLENSSIIRGGSSTDFPINICLSVTAGKTRAKIPLPLTTPDTASSSSARRALATFWFPSSRLRGMGET